MKQQISVQSMVPTKRTYLSIIKDYDPKTALCELIDNSIDHWRKMGDNNPLKIEIDISERQQSISFTDNAGGVLPDDLKVLVTPGESKNDPISDSIGLFGVGSKRSVVALSQEIKITTRHKKGESFHIEYNDEWLKEDSWDLPIYKGVELDPGHTKIELTKLRYNFDYSEIEKIEKHLSSTYAVLIDKYDIELMFQGKRIVPQLYENWSYNPTYEPRNFSSELTAEDGGIVKFDFTVGLVREKGSIDGDYGFYSYCNDRLIDKHLKAKEVGFGKPHHGISLVRAILKLNGPAQHMPWNSSKTAIIFHANTFKAIQHLIIEAVSNYCKICQSLIADYDEAIIPYSTGNIQSFTVPKLDRIASSFFPPVPRKKEKYSNNLNSLNAEIFDKKPWTRGAGEGVAVVHEIIKTKLNQKNRFALIILDSILEIAFKDYLVYEATKHYCDADLVKLFSNRHAVCDEIKKYVQLSDKDWPKIKYYYNLRCKLVHERSSANITDTELQEYRTLVQRVIKKLFNMRWPNFGDTY